MKEVKIKISSANTFVCSFFYVKSSHWLSTVKLVVITFFYCLLFYWFGLTMICVVLVFNNLIFHTVLEDSVLSCYLYHLYFYLCGGKSLLNIIRFVLEGAVIFDTDTVFDLFCLYLIYIAKNVFVGLGYFLKFILLANGLYLNVCWFFLS